ncbi:MAG: hypothetical protein KGZ85_12960 [Ignavibacterium sp.]|nr:hypothetical protein [Ignavibacterium sp.]
MQNLIKLFSLIIFCSSFVYAQYSENPLYDEFKDEFSKEYLKIGLLVQVGGLYQYEQPNGSNGFELSNFRLKLSGEFDKGIGYMVQTAFTGSPAILDARIYYKISKAFVVDAGLYKTPFSREFLISAANIDFVSRAQLASLSPNRQIGVQARGVIPGTVLSYAAGVFNGNRFSNNQNDNNEFLYTGRLALNPDITGGTNNNDKLEIAVNVAQSNDGNVNVSRIDPNFNGKRFLVGGDTRLEYNNWLLTAEAIYGKFEPAVGSEFKPFSYQATVGYMFLDNFQGLVRWDSFKLDKNLDPADQVIVGLNFWPSQISQFQLNYVVPTKSTPKEHRVLVNAQIGF